MDNYERFTDEELIERLRSGEQELEDYLMEKYKGMVLKKAHAMFIVGGEREDLIDHPDSGNFPGDYPCMHHQYGRVHPPEK